MKYLLLIGILVFSAFSTHASDGSPPQDENESPGSSTTVTPGYEFSIDGKRLVVRQSSNPDGNILLISNRTDFEIRVYDNLELDANDVEASIFTLRNLKSRF